MGCGSLFRYGDPGDHAETQPVAANVTGANRLLIGIGWSVVILIYWFKHRAVLDLHGHIGPELTFLTVATLLTFVLFFIREVYLLVAGSLVVIYVVYLWIASRRPAEEPDLSGITATLGSPPALWRRTTIVLLFGYATGIIIIAAEPFVYSLVETGQGGESLFGYKRWSGERNRVAASLPVSLSSDSVRSVVKRESAEG